MHKPDHFRTTVRTRDNKKLLVSLRGLPANHGDILIIDGAQWRVIQRLWNPDPDNGDHELVLQVSKDF